MCTGCREKPVLTAEENSRKRRPFPRARSSRRSPTEVLRGVILSCILLFLIKLPTMSTSDIKMPSFASASGEDGGAPPLILEVSVRSSRFHEAAADSINLKGINITVGGRDEDDVDGAYATERREILEDADLQLNQGGKYALIARNGVGKTILLKVLASGVLFDPDSQLSLRIQLVTQSFAPPPRADWTVLDEINVPPFGHDLSEALDPAKRAERRSALRSGKRGKLAREEALVTAAAAAAAATGGLGRSASSEGGASILGDDTDRPKMADIVQAFKTMEIPVSMLERPYSELSGGWKMRVTLAKTLLYQPSILLLDEPTNHLDIAGINSLIALLKTSGEFDDTTIVFTSHDLFFVNEVADHIVLMQDKTTKVSKGNWDTLQRERGDRKKFTDRYAEQQEKEKERLLSSIESSMAKAGKDDKLKKQLAGRKEKLMERGTGMMRNSRGHRFRKQDDENAGYFNTLLDAVEVIKEERPVHFRFDKPTLGRAVGAGASSSAAAADSDNDDLDGVFVAATMLSVDGPLVFAFGGASAIPAALIPPKKLIAPPPSSLPGGKKKKGGSGGASGPLPSKASLAAAAAAAKAPIASTDGSFCLTLSDLNVALGERLVLLGPNGHGKTTLLRLLLDELTPQYGSVSITAPTVGYFDQHCVSRLGGEKRSVLDFVLESRKEAGHSFGGRDEEETSVKRTLGSFGLGPHMGTPVALLSGGQRVALQFVLISLRRPALLILDEPSGHLDLQAREGLANAIAGFEGAVVFISHDIGFIDACQPTRALFCKHGRFERVEEEDWMDKALAL